MPIASRMLGRLPSVAAGVVDGFGGDWVFASGRGDRPTVILLEYIYKP
jgi:hypothetical protein